MTIETTVRGGLPVTASATVHRCSWHEYPGGDYIEDLEVRFLSGHDYPGAISDKDEDRISLEIIDAWRSNDEMETD